MVLLVKPSSIKQFHPLANRVQHPITPRHTTKPRPRHIGKTDGRLFSDMSGTRFLVGTPPVPGLKPVRLSAGSAFAHLYLPGLEVEEVAPGGVVGLGELHLEKGLPQGFSRFLHQGHAGLFRGAVPLMLLQARQEQTTLVQTD